jgi:uncharacterized protein (DUF2267 family)
LEGAGVAFELVEQEPTLIRGIYYEDWDPSRTPVAIHDLDAFLDRVAHDGRMTGETEASLAVTAVTHTLRRHLSGEIEELLAVLPDKFKTLIEA